MNMNDLAVQYRQSAQLLQQRIDELKNQLKTSPKMRSMDKLRLCRRIERLAEMHRQAIEAAYTMEKYYEERWRRCAAYTI